MGETGELVFELETEIGGIAKACGLPEAKVRSAAALLVEGNTIPFIARYRKERTGTLSISPNWTSGLSTIRWR